MATIDLGLVDGQAWSASHVDTIEAFINANCVKPGTVQSYIGTSAPTGWAKLDGSTVVNAQTLYTELWAIAPAAWKSGSSLILPDAGSMTMLGQSLGTVGAAAGANTKTIAQANLPAHTHTTASQSLTTGAQSADHTHTYSGATSGHSADHTHASGLGNYITRTSGGSFTFAGGGSDAVYDRATSAGTSNDHTHTYSGTSSGMSVSHTHSVTVAAGVTGSIGSGTALDVIQSGLVITWILKLV
jgi:microcystin-dependent protein